VRRITERLFPPRPASAGAAESRPITTSAPAPGLQEAPPWDLETLYLALLVAAISLVSFAYFLRHGEILSYGDATAHINIARRVFDSRNPGLSQLGTVWLPLPHLLIMPFVLANWAWQSGVGGSIPSMAAYVAGAVGIFRLVRGALPANAGGQVAAYCAVFIYAANPNLIYLQATAMTEPLYLALFLWATVFFSEFVRATRTAGAAAQSQRRSALRRCAWLLFAAMLTRYDGWFVAAVFVLAVFAVLWVWREGRIGFWRSPLRPLFAEFVLIVALAPTLWLVYNTVYWRNPLEFATGPYSARAIEANSPRPGWRHPGWHDLKTSAVYFLRSAKLNLAASPLRRETEQPPSRWRLENWWLVLAILGTGLLLVWGRELWPWLLLWLPLPFYTLSIAWGEVPVFLPVWWPYSYYNIRYGLQLLPAFALFLAFVVYFIGSRWQRRGVLAGAAGLLLSVAAGSYLMIWRAVPICLQEARANSAERVLFDRTLANELHRLPPGATVLMYTANHSAALEFAGFPLRRTINETDNKLWRAALLAPGAATSYVLAFQTEDDPVWKAVQRHPDELKLLTIVSAPGQPSARLYVRRQ